MVSPGRPVADAIRSCRNGIVTLRGREPNDVSTIAASSLGQDAGAGGAESGAVADVARLQAFVATLTPADRAALLGLLAADPAGVS